MQNQISMGEYKYTIQPLCLVEVKSYKDLQLEDIFEILSQTQCFT